MKALCNNKKKSQNVRDRDCKSFVLKIHMYIADTGLGIRLVNRLLAGSVVLQPSLHAVGEPGQASQDNFQCD